jgi:hypothetical protein
MGWFRDAIDWIVNSVFRPFVEWITFMIDQLVKSLRKARIKFGYALADWLQDDTFFFCAFVALIAAAFILPAVSAWIKTIMAKFYTSALVLAIKKGIANIKDIKKIIDLKFLSDILKIIMPEYKKALLGLNAALSSFAKELGEDTAFIHSYIALGRGITAGTTALLGLPPESTELSWYEKASEWSAKLRSRVDRYVDNPERIFNDIIDEVLIPLQDEYSTVQQAELDELKANIDRVREIEGGIKLLESSVSTFIESMPEEIEAVMLAKVGPALTSIREALDSLDTNLLDSVDAIYLLLKEHENRITRMNEIVEEKRWEIRKQFAESLLWPQAERWEFHMDVANLVLDGIDVQAEEEKVAVMPIIDDWSAKITAYMEGLEAVPSLSYEPTALALPAVPSGEAGKSWFVGEY